MRPRTSKLSVAVDGGCVLLLLCGRRLHKRLAAAFSNPQEAEALARSIAAKIKHKNRGHRCTAEQRLEKNRKQREEHRGKKRNDLRNRLNGVGLDRLTGLHEEHA